MGDDIKEVRKKNLRRLIDEQFGGSVNAFAKHIKRPSGFFYDAFANRRPLGERIMRFIESELGLVPHELDRAEINDFQSKKFELIPIPLIKLSNNYSYKFA